MILTNQNDLQKLIQRARATDAVALDTEFVWERTYTPHLGLIQLALSDEECFLIDPLAITDLSPLGELLADPDVVKIFHDAPQDLCILSRATSSVPQNIFDTRLSAGFAGLPATLSLSNLVKELLDIELPKTETRTNWLQRPLNDKQICYALDDVRYLRAARVLLLSSVMNGKVQKWLEEELAQLNDPTSYQGIDARLRYQRVKGAGSLNKQGLAILRELTAWRELQAEKNNRPRGHVVHDRILVAIAKNKLNTPEQLRDESGISEKGFKRYGKAILHEVSKGLATDTKAMPPLLRSLRLSAKEKELFERLQKLITLKSDIVGLDSTLIGNTAELKFFIKHRNAPSKIDHLRLAHGWRKVFLEDLLH